MGRAKKILAMVLIFLLLGMPCIIVEGKKYEPTAKIIINLSSSTLSYYEGKKLIKVYPIAIGKSSTPTPCGLFRIVDKEINPCWYPPNKRGIVVPSGPQNPLGYRWMGFGGTYGIHGTNEPWSIGAAASNGCIRMYEEDVEELFSNVSYNTPVIISEQETSENYLGINRSSIKVDDKELEDELVVWDDIIYAPVLAVAASLNREIIWDEEQQAVSSQQGTVAGKVKNNIVYVAIQDLPALFTIRQSWDEYKQCIRIYTLEDWRPGPSVAYQVQRIDDVAYLPLIAVAKELGKEINWDKSQTNVWLGTRKITVKIVAEQPYVAVSKISEYFNASVTWDVEGETVDIHYWCWPMDYSMSLGEMADMG